MYNKNMDMEKIGILGGAFDPPHIEHIRIAENAIKEFGYNRVIFLPSYNPPHKKLVSSVKDRLEMLKLIVPNENISEVEIGQSNITYTVNIIPKLKEIYGDNIELIIGGDSMRDFHTWHKPFEILKQIKLVVACRDYQLHEVKEAISLYDGVEKIGIELMKYQPESMSSTSIRNAIRLGYDVSDKLDSRVIEYIENNKLYAEYDGIIAKLKDNLRENTYIHSLSTCLFALKYVGRLNLDYEQVFISALLHDCAKCINDYSQFNIPQGSKATAVAHAFAGKIIANSEYGIKDSKILEAIYYHTTARPNMTTLEKLIFCADKLEYNRNYDGIDVLRNAFEENFAEGFKKCLEHGIKYLKDNNKEIYPLTLEAWEFYKD